MEQQTSEQLGTAGTAAAGNPLSPPLPSAPSEARVPGERSTTPQSQESLLGSALPAETPTQELARAALAEPAAPARPTYTEFKLPEGVALDAEQLAPATELFAD